MPLAAHISELVVQNPAPVVGKVALLAFDAMIWLGVQG